MKVKFVKNKFNVKIYLMFAVNLFQSLYLQIIAQNMNIGISKINNVKHLLDIMVMEIVMTKMLVFHVCCKKIKLRFVGMIILLNVQLVYLILIVMLITNFSKIVLTQLNIGIHFIKYV